MIEHSNIEMKAETETRRLDCLEYGRIYGTLSGTEMVIEALRGTSGPQEIIGYALEQMRALRARMEGRDNAEH